jgi:hypothetical protein
MLKNRKYLKSGFLLDQSSWKLMKLKNLKTMMFGNFFKFQFLPNSDLISIPNINRHPLAFLQQNITAPDDLELNFVKTNGTKLIYSFRIQHQI